MAALHSALQALGPVSYSDVPANDPQLLGEYMSTHFAKAQLIAESIPPPVLSQISKDKAAEKGTRPRSDTAASATSAADLTTSNISSEALVPEHAALNKEWGKPLKIAPKDNPLGIAVHKLAAKDGRGAWFARRSVHEGLGFDRWKEALLREFPESLAIQGAPGEGNIRGIGGEARLEHVEVDGVGNLTVYRLSAQFPGPTTPRDFVTLILASTDALTVGDQPAKDPYSAGAPRHLITISKPCMHSGAEPRSDFIRGSYESIEMIREVPRKRKKKKQSVSAIDLPKSSCSSTLAKDAIVRRAVAGDENKSLSESVPALGSSDTSSLNLKRSSTYSEADSPSGFDWTEESDPIEWVMVTRSDPGGSVPRFMVERGSPASICADAKKFIDWACSKDFSEKPLYELDERHSSIALQRNASLAGLPGQEVPRRQRRLSEDSDEEPTPKDNLPEPPKTAGILSSMAQAAYSGIESYASHAVNLTRSATDPPSLQDRPLTRSSSSSSTSVGSFASAEDYISDETSSKSKTSSQKTNMTPEEKEFAKLESRKAKLAEKLQKAKAKQGKDQEQLTEREAKKAREAEEKHAKEVAKAEERHAKEMQNLETRRRKEERKLLERKEREARRERERVQKSERDDLRAELALLVKERDLLKESCRQLQAENTRIVAAVGKMDGGEELLKDIRAPETVNEGK